MDELWQRYRSFWVPVLIGVGVFLVGLIVVFILTDDPQAWQDRVAAQDRDLGQKVEPTSGKIEDLRRAAAALQERVDDWAVRLDQARGKDPVTTAVADALRASILRGLTPEEIQAATASPDAGSSQASLARFEGDEVAAARALQRYAQARDDRLRDLQAGDPNVGFTRLLSDVWSELSVRANRADVEMGAEWLGFGGAQSVTRATLPERLLNLALAAEVVDLAIRSDVDAVEEIRYERRANPDGADVFLKEWPVTFALTGTTASLRPLVLLLTDPAHPRPLLSLVAGQPRRGTPEAGRIRLEITVSSTMVRPAVDLNLSQEEPS